MANISPEFTTDKQPETRTIEIPIERTVPTIAHLYLNEFQRSIYQITPELRDPDYDSINLCGGETGYRDLINELVITRVVESAATFERPNAGWQSHRRAAAQRLTGFEPYFIGSGLNPDGIANDISAYFRGFVDVYRKAHADYSGPDLFWQIKALMRGEIAPERRGGIAVRAVGIMDQIMSYMTAEYRKLMEPEAVEHRDNMRRRLQNIRPYTYKADGTRPLAMEAHGIVQVPIRPELSPPTGGSYNDTKDLANPYIFVKEILGQVGDPVIRGTKTVWMHSQAIGIPASPYETEALLKTREVWSKRPKA